ncbi:MAG TPA: sulfatase-like hydrolase/transferase [Acidobacteriota bacterium]
MRRVKSLLFLLVVVSVAIIFGPWRSVGAKADRPNILIIVADDLGYADVGVNGCKDVPTPNIDSLARNGVRFTNGYVSGPYCSPTRAALLTGRYQQRFGHEFNPGPEATADPNFGLPLTETTLADRLKAAGYATALVGKWHLGYRPEFHPQKRGFDEFFGFLGGAHSYLHNNDGAIMRGTEPVRQMTYTTDMFGDEAVSFIERHRGKPWFLYLAFNADHGPMEAAERYMPRVSHIQDPLRRTFAAMHTALDDNVGRVLTLLHKQRLEENTLIFFFSDNGGPTRVNASRNNPLRGFKAQTWEGGIRIPFIVQWKGKLPSGKVYDYPVIQMDIPVTSMMAARVDIKPEWKLDGVDLLPYLNRKNKARPHGALYWRFGPQLAIRESEWKLVRAPGAGADFIERRTPASTEGAHLYNLATDIGEQNNLAEREPDKVRHLAAAWEAWNRELEQPRWIPGNANRAQRQRR